MIAQWKKELDAMPAGQYQAVKSFVINEGIKGVCLLYIHYLKTLAKMVRLQHENERLKRIAERDSK